MTSTTIAAVVAPSAPTLVAPTTTVPCRSSVPVVTIRSVDLPNPGDGIGGTSGGRLIRRKEFLSETNRTTSLKTLSCDLSEILVKNLSLRRSETSERRSHADTLDELSATSSDSVQQHPQCRIITAGSGTDCVGSSGSSGSVVDSSDRAQGTLCDTFTSVNKLIRLKRVSSDGNNLNRLSAVVTTNVGGGANYTKIVDQSVPGKPPLGSLRRVEISVCERTPSPKPIGNSASVSNRPAVSGESESESCEEESGNELSQGVVRKSVIVNQLDQVDERCPLLVVDEDGRTPTIALQKKKSTLVFTRKKVPESSTTPAVIARRSSDRDLTSDATGSSCGTSKVLLRRRVRLSGDWLGKSVENSEKREVKRRSLQWPVGLSSAAGSDSRTAHLTDVLECGRRSRGDTPNKFRHSWNAPGYDILEEDSGVGGKGADLGKDFASIIHNLAGLRNHHLANGTHESVSLLEQHSPQIVPSRATRPTSLGGSGQGLRRGPTSWIQSSPMVPTSGVGTGVVGGVGGGGNGESSPHTGALSSGPAPRRRRIQIFLKNLVGRRPSKEAPPAAPPPPSPPLLSSPEIKISKSPSEHNLAEITRSRLNISTTSLSSVHQKLWSVVPLLKRDVSCNSLASPKTTPLLLDSQMASSGECTGGHGLLTIGGLKDAGGPGGLRKCETVLALTNATSQTLEPIRPLNRLRNCASVATCSRCSSLLSLAAAGSRYSLNASNGAFVPVSSGGSHDGNEPPDVPKPKKASIDGGSKRKYVGNLLRLTTTSCSSSSSSSAASSPSSSATPSSSSSGASSPSPNSATGSPAGGASVSSKTVMFAPSPTQLVPVSPINSSTSITMTTTKALTPTIKFTCKLCLGEFSAENLTRITQCACSFCTECMTAYIEFEISEGAYEVSCPDAMCPAQGIITIAEITELASSSLVEKHHRYRLNREVELDRFRTWCPKAGCETICLVGASEQQAAGQAGTNQTGSTVCTDRIVPLSPSSSSMPSPCAVHCPTCREDFCSGCKKTWHPTMSCEENSRRLAVDGQTDALGIPFDNDLIKCCPMCTVPIEKDEGCAQMMCKRCKHVFCWYCLASLDDDFLLRHYDKGPCKNKLGHSRASVVWHRAQVIGIFAGFGILLLVASPLLLLAAPCIVCCKCRICSGAAKLEETEVDYDDAAVALHSSSGLQR
ncbi:mucin-5AC [Anopheles funestus]|uniref:mucin-5AC n=1 Tax=Anopheles funestus TaxID=62324 RepID=UPI0020C72FB3|nr:mucin-5AC [Anopheles funestus]XP_049292925.1 mucin-5AC [Anopheles funestus]XP_049292926.1 mucin-5AC [Anopheles funestus]XP_049292927.1 mucin-5AC [Anopheles funestus]XP_049292928.1 mucin-5AC [Anopheles funestus]XP_049292929.1 mucin-5AC [Anopheles funestus]XP_049292930.1 mucin-5AC [Anopheles funestus]XP_049292931.1 mucin-5AC [Anopheles funestus]